MASHDRLRVLLVEDERDLREEVVAALNDLGFQSEGCADASQLYSKLAHAPDPWDIVVLDIGLPDEDGLTVARTLRRDTNLGIVMFTARGEVSQRVMGLEGGADAYMVKPVDLRELAATLRGVARRLTPAKPPCWRLEDNDWFLSAPNSKTVELTAPERTCLGLLLSRAGVEVSREALVTALAGKAVAAYDPHRLDMLVHRLRAKVSAATGLTLPVKAVRGAGYVFVMGEK